MTTIYEVDLCTFVICKFVKLKWLNFYNTWAEIINSLIKESWFRDHENVINRICVLKKWIRKIVNCMFIKLKWCHWSFINIFEIVTLWMREEEIVKIRPYNCGLWIHEEVIVNSRPWHCKIMNSWRRNRKFATLTLWDYEFVKKKSWICDLEIVNSWSGIRKFLRT